ncbi:MAG TPA: DUF4911 domain-containing protein [Polyangiaceae bacterium]|jgi:hypothetical protein|nr:MAG: hypothetical protein BWY17_04194 [Deltaproteobacteria bacterium ADurb.Bin207]HOT09098.1 DUF4911 domain-containing protein [Polyangiaceae bacterium]
MQQCRKGISQVVFHDSRDGDGGVSKPCHGTVLQKRRGSDREPVSEQSERVEEAMSVPIPTVDDDALVWYRIRVVEKDVAFVRGILEASEGLACMFAEKGGDLMLVSPSSQQQRLEEVIEDLRVELGAIVTERGTNGGRKRESSS